MTTQVLACIDASPYAEAICDYAAWAARQLSAPITLVHALDKAQHTQTPDLSGSIGLGSQELLLQQLAELDEKHSKLALQRGRSILTAAKERAEQAGVTAVDTCMQHGPLPQILAGLAETSRLLVLGKRGFSSADAHGHMGVHVERVIRTVQRPVLLTQQHYKTPQRIMLAYDGSATAQKSLQMLAASPLCRGLPVHLVMADADSESSRSELNSAAEIMRSAGFDTKTAIVDGEPEVVLHQYQQEHVIDLLVMGAYGHSRIRQFIVGSTTTAMICKAKCSLLILR
ncbi:MAG: universal stress protein [Gammaproteobacteria bacterium]|nr:universal stress protein [Gammaproteobacteria bacterium]MBU1553677.1 universal stress protein [Gammaproteobacteria bacterium]MBU2071395.1 universal stress protein [Gammaproteobacteria bacterium]MBU2182407.1 universal stress protein [Gammaproteobacteria bacterium]MBU2204145.1 universal stress protein [Gammaproteobacteria bacterium]